jgi:IS30 family transposase
MQIHGRAKLGPAGRLALCQAIEQGCTFRQAALSLGVSPATAHRWWHRYRAASAQKRHSLAWAADRRSRPHRSPRLLDRAAQERICEARRRTGWGPRLIAGQTGHPHSTVWRCSTDTGSHGGRASHVTPCVATSGRARVICCTWTRPDMHALSALGIAPPVIAHSATADGWPTARGWATTSLTRSSTITPVWPMSSYTQTSGRRR